MIAAIISTLGVFFGSIFGLSLKYYLENRKLKNKTFSETTSQIINEQILIPFRFSIEMSLYKHIISADKELTADNQIMIEHILYSLKQLQERINAHHLVHSSMNDFFLSYLSNTIISMSSEKPNMRIINKNFQAFSDTYFDLLNKVRKSNFLPPRGEQYRVAFHLYKQKNAKRFQNSRTRNKAFLYTFIYLVITTFGMFLIVSLVHLAEMTYIIFWQLYNMTN